MTNAEKREVNYYKNLANYYKKLFKMLQKGYDTGNRSLEHKARVLFETTEETK